MAYDSDNQFYHRMLGKTPHSEFGKLAFAGTALTVEIALGHIATSVRSFTITPKTEPNDYEKFYCDGTITSQAVTLTRKCTPITLLSSPEDSAYLSTNVWLLAPVGFSPVAGTITGMSVFNKTNDGGTKNVINLGVVKPTVLLTDTTGATNGFVVGETVIQATTLARGVVTAWDDDNGDMTPGILTVRTLEGVWDGNAVTSSATSASMTPDTHVPTAATVASLIDAGNAWLMPEDAATAVIRSDEISVGDAIDKWTSVDVAAGDLIIFGTTLGDTTAPSGLAVQVEITPTVTSGLEFYYDVKGR